MRFIHLVPDGNSAEWWSRTARQTEYTGDDERACALSYIISAMRGAGLDIMSFRSSIARAAVATPQLAECAAANGETILASATGQQAAYWLAVYGALNSKSFPDISDIASNIGILGEREVWISLVTMNPRTRTHSDRTRGRYAARARPTRVGYCESHIMDRRCQLNEEHQRNASFWLAVLDESPERFIDNHPVEFETVPPGRSLCAAPMAFGEEECFQLATDDVWTVDSTRASPTSHHVVCGRHRSEFARLAQGSDGVERWYLTDRTFEVRTANGEDILVMTRERFERMRADGDIQVCARCNTGIIQDEPLDECPACGRNNQPNIVNQNHRAAPPEGKLYGEGENESNCNLFFGVELEVEFSRCQNPSAALRGISKAGALVIKRDGSLHNGAEIVSAAMTYQRWCEDSGEWTERLNALRKVGMRSYDPGTCGMHIHVSREAFSPTELLKLMELVYTNGALFMTIAQRPHNAYCTFDGQDGQSRSDRLSKVRAALMRDSVDDKSRQRFMKRIWRPTDDLEYRHRHLGDHHVAVSFSSSYPTVELRFFRGTLNAPSFWKNLECAVSLVDFVKSVSLKEVTGQTYMQFVSNNRWKYKHLAAFLDRRTGIVPDRFGNIPSFALPQPAIKMKENPYRRPSKHTPEPVVFPEYTRPLVGVDY